MSFSKKMGRNLRGRRTVTSDYIDQSDGEEWKAGCVVGNLTEKNCQRIERAGKEINHLAHCLCVLSMSRHILFVLSEGQGDEACNQGHPYGRVAEIRKPIRL